LKWNQGDIVMAALPVTAVLEVLFETLKNSHRTVDQINASHELPPAFPNDASGNPKIPGDPDYRFEGFGVIVSLPPRLSFYVHYKPDSDDHIALGQFTVSIGLDRLIKLNRVLEDATSLLSKA
jgi:hypothetical protein